MNCACSSARNYAACCGRYVDADAGTGAPDAEALMRSRYTAYVRRDAAYLLATWHASTRPAALDLDAEPRSKWLELTVRRHEQPDADHAVVEFVARHRVAGRGFRLHELSRFVRENGRWFYLDGDIDPAS